MSEHVSPLDATFLELEEADPSAHMHIGGVMIFDPLTGGGAPALDAVRELLLERLSAMPRFHQRLSEPTTGGLTWPSWVHDEAFDITRHVRRAALPAPGGEAELTEWAAEFWSHRLERTRPLWEMVLLEGLEDGRWALASKTHHCMVDGVGSVDVTHLLLDATPEPAARPAPDGTPAPDAGGGGLAHLPAALLHGIRAGVDAVLHPSELAEISHRGRALADLLLRNEVRAAPRSSLNGPIGKQRRFAVADARLDDLKAIKRALGGTVNDVALAAVTGGLRAVLEAREETPPAGLRAMVPVNVRGAAEQLALGNRITSLFVHLPVDEENALVRYARVLQDAEHLKAGDQAMAGSTLVQLAGLAPPLLHSVVAQSLFATRLFNVTVTNVPGPQMTLYAFGSPMRRVLGLVPLAAEHAVGVAILSYDGTVTFNVIADRDSVPDVDLIVGGIEETLEELLGHADPRPLPRPHRRAGAARR